MYQNISHSGTLNLLKMHQRQKNEYNANSTREHNKIHASKPRVLIGARKFREAMIHHGVTKHRKPFQETDGKSSREGIFFSRLLLQKFFPDPPYLLFLLHPLFLHQANTHTHSQAQSKIKQAKEPIIFERAKRTPVLQ